MLLRIGLDKAFEQLDPPEVVDVGQQMQTWLIGEAGARFMGSEALLTQSWEEVEQIASGAASRLPQHQPEEPQSPRVASCAGPR